MVKTSKHPRMELQDEYGDPIYVSKKLYDGITKKVEVLNIRPLGRKIEIQFKSKRGGSRGILELYDLGPAPIKKEQPHNG